MSAIHRHKKKTGKRETHLTSNLKDEEEGGVHWESNYESRNMSNRGVYGAVLSIT